MQNRTKRECSLLGCARPHRGKGLCRLHYERQKNGVPLDLPLGYRLGPEFCCVSDCTDKHYAKGFCNLHYKRKKQGRPLDAPRGHGRIPVWDWAACGTPAQYKKHLRHKIPVCEPCRRAENRRQVDSRRKRGRDKYNARRRERWAANPEYYRRRQREARALKR